MKGAENVEKYMGPVADAISRHLKEGSCDWVDVYNRAYEAVSKALDDKRHPDCFDSGGGGCNRIRLGIKKPPFSFTG